MFGVDPSDIVPLLVPLSNTIVAVAKSNVPAFISIPPPLNCKYSAFAPPCLISTLPLESTKNPVEESATSVALSSVPILNLSFDNSKLVPVKENVCDFKVKVEPSNLIKLLESDWKLNSPLPLKKIPLSSNCVGMVEPIAIAPPCDDEICKVFVSKSKVSDFIVNEPPSTINWLVALPMTLKCPPLSMNTP